LQEFYDDWLIFNKKNSNKFKRLLYNPIVPNGIYIWGGVGRGKSFLMDIFFSEVPIKKKLRIHFHEFMRDVHRELDKEKKLDNPLQQVAKKVAIKNHLICFDEFHISDIADAMILYNLFEVFFKKNISFIMTSNFAPENLYPDGLHRDRLLPGIELLEKNLDIINLNGNFDYRNQIFKNLDIYHYPLDKNSESKLLESFNRLADSKLQNPVVKIKSRKIYCFKRAGGVIWSHFRDLCQVPCSQIDYLELSRLFHTVIISNIPEMNEEMSSVARRFTWLIDILYETKVKIIISAEVKPEMLYKEGIFSNEFKRTVSRLNEMMSYEYKNTKKKSFNNLLR